MSELLAQVAKEVCPDRLLDAYHAECHPVAARALRYTMAQGALQRRDDRMEALVEVVSPLAGMDEPRKSLAGLISGLDIRYDLGDGHPQLGRRIPDLDLQTSGGALRMFQLLHQARPVLVTVGKPARLDIAPWDDRVRLVEATCHGPWELPVLGVVDTPTAVLVRPDGYVAWVGHGTDEGLRDALVTWFGPPTRRRPPPTVAPGREPEHRRDGALPAGEHEMGDPARRAGRLDVEAPFEFFEPIP